MMNLHNVFHSSSINIHSHQKCLRVPFSPHPLQHLLFLDFMMIATLTGVMWDLTVMICISLIINNVEHIFMWLLTICTSSLEKSLFKSSAYFFIEWFIFWCSVVWTVFMLWMLTHYWSYHLQVLSHIQWIVFSFCQWYLSLCKAFKFNLSICLFCFCFFWLKDEQIQNCLQKGDDPLFHTQCKDLLSWFNSWKLFGKPKVVSSLMLSRNNYWISAPPTYFRLIWSIKATYYSFANFI